LKHGEEKGINCQVVAPGDGFGNMINAGSFELFMPEEEYTRKSSNVPSPTTLSLMGSTGDNALLLQVKATLSGS
jgi:hypothetical protein